MITTSVRTPDGGTIKVQHPEGANKESILAFAKQEYDKRQQQKAQAQQGPSGFAAFANKSLVQLAGTPVDVTNALLSSVGLDQKRPAFGSESIESAAEAIGINIPDREPETLLKEQELFLGNLRASACPL